MMNSQLLFNAIISGLLYGLVALGYSLIYSGSKVFHIAHGALYTSTAYLYLIFLFIFQSFLTISVSIALSALCSLGMVSFLGYGSEIFVYRPLYLKKASSLVTFISSLGFYIILVNIIALSFGNKIKVLKTTIEPSFYVVGAIITRIQAVQFLISLAMIVGVLVLLHRTSLGRHIRALSDNPVLLSVHGVDAKRVRAQVFVLGTLLAGTASLLKAFDVGVDPFVGLSVVLMAAVAVIIGGVGFHLGAVLGALLIGFTQNLAVWYISAQWQEAATFIVLIVVLLVRKEGLFAFRLRAEE